MNSEIAAYNQSQSDYTRQICDALSEQIEESIDSETASSKIWHGSPVWFLDGNPIVGYAVRKGYVQLLFWSGQSFDEPGLEIEGTFKAAQVQYTSVDQIVNEDLNRWLEKSKTIQWDYKNIVKRKGQLERLI